MKPMIVSQLVNEWEEIDKTFVGNIVGGGEWAGEARQLSKLWRVMIIVQYKLF